MEDLIKVNYRKATDLETTEKFIQELESLDIIGCDFEVAVKYTPEYLKGLEDLISNKETSRAEVIKAKSQLEATALDHPSHCVITHFSVGLSESEGMVFVTLDPDIRTRVLEFITTTKVVQVWHGATYDFKHIFYATRKFPINYEDSQVLAKTLLNHVNTHKALTGLKGLALHWYGEWGIDSEEFTVEGAYKESTIEYAAIDACATYKIFEHMNEFCDNVDSDILEEYNETYGNG